VGAKSGLTIRADVYLEQGNVMVAEDNNVGCRIAGNRSFKLVAERDTKRNVPPTVEDAS
jgi:hypothetical protein